MTKDADRDLSAQTEPEEPVSQRTHVSASLTQTFSGPLPPPDLLIRYNDAVPDGADRILRMAESQSAHRRDIEKSIVVGNISSERRGQHYALILALLGLALAGALIWNGKNIEGFAVFIIELAALVGVFIFGRAETRKERKQQREQGPKAQLKLPLD